MKKSFPSQINKVIRTSEVCFGRPRIINTRLEVYNIVSDIETMTMNEIVKYCEDWEIDLMSVTSAVDYCKKLECQKIQFPFERYCSGCILSTLHEEYNYNIPSLEKIDNEIFYDKDNNVYLIGDLDDLQEEEFGRPGWIIANRITSLDP